MRPQITYNIISTLEPLSLRDNYSQIAVLVDENTEKYCLPLFTDILNNALIIEIKSGEEHKNLESCKTIWEALTQANFDRNSLMINLGGGVIGDMGGFCASTYKRGIDFINIPTTLLSQVDASIGGKLGIDFNGFKNHIGLFKNPKTVIIDSQFLKTLSKRELRSGFAEIIKHSIIADIEQWNFLKVRKLEELDLGRLVTQSIEIKAKVVDEDPLEKGKRKILNYGHSIGHAVESFFLDTDNKLLHGEAIAVGMICEAFIAKKKGLISQEELSDISGYVIGLFGKINLQKNDYIVLEERILQDKKNKAGKILMALPAGIGRAQWDIEVDQQLITSSFDYYVQY